MPDPSPTTRNAPCPCGSGRRFKHCCGLQPTTRYRALAAHQAGALGLAETLYRQALAENASDVDALHMLGTVEYERMRYREALAHLWDAAQRTAWSVPAIRHNLGLVLGKLLTRDANAQQAALLGTWVARDEARRQARSVDEPLVSVVMPAYNHARYVGEAIASVAAQTYPHVELIVIDDGSRDATAEVVELALAAFGRPSHFVRRDNRGAAATLNEGATLANGRYLAFLNSDDCYTPDRIETLVDAIARTASAWGFSLVSHAYGDAAPPAGAVDIQQKQRNFLGSAPPSFTFVEFNVAVSSGNLFVAREFFDSVGGFRDHRYNHDWDFCLRACARAEPVVVERPLYRYRLHGSNTIAESKARATQDADRVVGDFLAKALIDNDATNDLSPWWPGNRTLLLRQVLRGGQGAIVPVSALRALADELRSEPPPVADHACVASQRTALVVLGMHRSGTSALAGVLNLCGAHLPDKLKPPKIGVNPKGFFEPEAVLDLNVRLMRQLGGDWCHVDFAVPSEGVVADEFVADASATIATEYEGQPLIAIKDPRICMLAPLWRRALVLAGYRPAFVVPIRNPLEVAQSLHARGDMSIAEGLALWRTYMQRVVEFADTHDDVLLVRYTELLDDWESVVERIARKLDVALDASRGDEIRRFLEKDLRNQSADDEALAARLSGPQGDAIRALYNACIARCDRAAGAVSMAESPERPVASACFVLCIENNAIREQALLLCRSIRRFAGRHADAQILAYAPRPGLGIDAATRRALADLGVEYVDAPLNTSCREYPPANRVFAGAHAEAHSDADFVIVCDSDTVWLDEPELPHDADVAVRVVDSKGSATRGPGDRFEDYWADLANRAGMPLDRLPDVTTTIGNERIRASYNAGFTIVRRRLGILARCASLFAMTIDAGMRPYRDSGIEIVASTGRVGRAGSEYWGSSQAALTLAIWSLTERVAHYPDSYNVPLHLIASEGEIDPRWLARWPVHLHYHWMFDARHHENAMELLARLRVPADRRAWLAERTPFRGDADYGRAAAKVSSPEANEPREKTGLSTSRASS